jgi:hypothetical protein
VADQTDKVIRYTLQATGTDQTSAALAAVTGALTQNAAATTELTSKLKLIQGGLSETTATASAAGSGIDEMTARVRTAGDAADEGGSKLRAFGMGIAHIHRGVTALNPELGGMVFGIETAARTAGGLSEVLGVGAVGGLVAGGLLGALVAASHLFKSGKKDVEEYSSAVSALNTNLEKSAIDFGELTKKISDNEKAFQEQQKKSAMKFVAEGGASVAALGEKGTGVSLKEAGERVRADTVLIDQLRNKLHDLETGYGGGRRMQEKETLRDQIKRLEDERAGVESYAGAVIDEGGAPKTSGSSKPKTGNRGARVPRVGQDTDIADLSASEIDLGKLQGQASQAKTQLAEAMAARKNLAAEEAFADKEKHRKLEEYVKAQAESERHMIAQTQSRGQEEEKVHAASIKRYHDNQKVAIEAFTKIGGAALHMAVQAMAGHKLSARAAIAAIGDVIVADGERHVIQGGAELIATLGVKGGEEAAEGALEIGMGLTMGGARSGGGASAGGGAARGAAAAASRPASPVAPNAATGAQNTIINNVNMPTVIRPDAQTGYHIQKHLDQAARQGLLPGAR